MEQHPYRPLYLSNPSTVDTTYQSIISVPTIDLHFLDAEKCNLVTVLDAETSATLQYVRPAVIH